MTTETERKEPPMLAGLYRIMEYAQDKKLCPLCGLEECDCWAPLATAIQAIQDMAPFRESQKTLTKALRDALAIAAPEMQHEIGRLGAILGKAEALEKGAAS